MDRAIVQKQNGLGAIRALHPGGDLRKAGSHFLEHGGTVYRFEKSTSRVNLLFEGMVVTKYYSGCRTYFTIYKPHLESKSIEQSFRH